jgi:hypothetical protein
MSVTSMESLKEKLFDICIVRWFWVGILIGVDIV